MLRPISLLLALSCALPLTLAAQEAAIELAKAQPRKKTPAPAPRGTPYADNAEALKFADEMAVKRGIDGELLRKIVGQAQKLPQVAQLMQPPPSGQPKNWAVYRSRFIDATRINAGVRFWQANRSTLERAEQEYGVPAEIIVGIIGVETIYGQQLGTFRVLDALATLAFDFPESHPRAAERTAYFRSELEQFIAYHHANRTSPLKPRGSYAGAMGMPQFMPSSLVRWGVDYDGDKTIDLTNSAEDVIGSVANYFKGYGWNTGMPTHYPVRLDTEKLDLEGLLAPDILPTFTVASFQGKGALLEGRALEHKGPLALIELQNGGETPTYVAGTENFYVITRYNWSSYYAMAVIELGREVKEALARQPRQAS